MKNVLVVVLFFFIAQAFPQNAAEFKKLFQQYKKSDELLHAQWSIYAAYADNGKVIFANDEDESCAPASNMKLITTAAGLHYLGKDYRYTTEVYTSGRLNDGVLDGNIIVRGGGDPTLGSSLIASSLPLHELMNQWVDSIAARGIKRITGSIIADDLAFEREPVPGNWFYADMGNYYGASAGGLCINDNLYNLIFTQGKDEATPPKVARTEPEIPGLNFDNQLRSGKKGSGDNAYIFAAPYQFNATIRGSIPMGDGEFTIRGSIPDPALFAAQFLKQSLLNRGITVNSEAQKTLTPIRYDRATLIATHFSPPLAAILEVINKRSFNLYAEQVLRTIAFVKQGKGSLSEGAKLVEAFLKELNVATGALMVEDGSGLSRINMISAKLMGDMLTGLSKKEYFKDYLSTISLAGDPSDIGFFKSFGKGTPVEMNARIKSGTIQQVKCHSGYVRDSKGRLIVFSFLANNHHGSSSAITGYHEKLVISLSKF